MFAVWLSDGAGARASLSRVLSLVLRRRAEALSLHLGARVSFWSNVI